MKAEDNNKKKQVKARYELGAMFKHRFFCVCHSMTQNKEQAAHQLSYNICFFKLKKFIKRLALYIVTLYNISVVRKGVNKALNILDKL